MNKDQRSFTDDVGQFIKGSLPSYLQIFARWIRYYAVIWISTIIIILLSLAFINYITTSKVILGYPHLGSSYRSIADSYKQFFAANRIDFQLVEATSLKQSAQKLSQYSSPVNASFSLSDYAVRQGENEFVSLGSIGIAPGWLFYRGDSIEGAEPISKLKRKRVSIGPPGSFSNRSYRELLKSFDVADGGSELLTLSDLEAVSALRGGEIDALWIVDNIQSSNIQALIADKNIKLYSWERASALVEKFKNIATFTIPAGYFSLAEDRPPRDVKLMASPITVLVESNLHPSLQWALLLAAKDYHDNHFDYLSSDNEFPAYIDKTVPLSPVAERFFSSGVPFFFRYLPIYIASLLEASWFWILTTLVLSAPIWLWVKTLLKKLDNFNQKTVRSEIEEDFKLVQDLVDRTINVRSRVELERIEEELNNIAMRDMARSLSIKDATAYYVFHLKLLHAREALNMATSRLK